MYFKKFKNFIKNININIRPSISFHAPVYSVFLCNELDIKR